MKKEKLCGICYDDKNVYYDFDKYKMGYSYIKNVPFDWVFVMNDSIIISDIGKVAKISKRNHF
jgi:hypothetical protein